MATFSGDMAAANEALTITDQYKLIELQKQVKNYSRAERAERLTVAEKTLYLANMAKYPHNTQARDALFRTGSNITGEATYSKPWGIREYLHDAVDLWKASGSEETLWAKFS